MKSIRCMVSNFVCNCLIAKGYLPNETGSNYYVDKFIFGLFRVGRWLFNLFLFYMTFYLFYAFNPLSWTHWYDMPTFILLECTCVGLLLRQVADHL